MVKKILSEKGKKRIRRIEALPWVASWRIAKLKWAVRSKRLAESRTDCVAKPSETLSNAELREKKRIRRLALKWNDNELLWDNVRASSQPVPASVIAFRSLTSVKMNAEKYFSQNPMKQVLVISAEQLYELDDGSYYVVRYPADLPVEEIRKICDDCEAMLLPCAPYFTDQQKPVTDSNTSVEPKPREDLNAATSGNDDHSPFSGPVCLGKPSEVLSDEEIRDKKRLRWRAMKWKQNKLKWDTAHTLGLQVSAKVAAIKADKKLEEDAEKFFTENPPKKLHVISAEHLFQLDTGEYYQVLYDVNLDADEIDKIQDLCDALLLPCDLYQGEVSDLYHP